jgi:hypothetical protein
LSLQSLVQKEPRLQEKQQAPAQAFQSVDDDTSAMRQTKILVTAS